MFHYYSIRTSCDRIHWNYWNYDLPVIHDIYTQSSPRTSSYLLVGWGLRRAYCNLEANFEEMKDPAVIQKSQQRGMLLRGGINHFDFFLSDQRIRNTKNYNPWELKGNTDGHKGIVIKLLACDKVWSSFDLKSFTLC